jgi:hypothetical protein
LKLAFSHSSFLLSSSVSTEQFPRDRDTPEGNKKPFFNGGFLEGGEGGDPFESRLPGGDRLFLGLLLFAFIGFLFSLVLSNELTIGIAPTVPTGKISYKTLKYS